MKRVISKISLFLCLVFLNTHCSPSQDSKTKFFKELFKKDIHENNIHQQQLFTGNGMLMCKGNIKNVGSYTITATIGAGSRVDMLGKIHSVALSYDILPEFLEEGTEQKERNFKFKISKYMSDDNPTFVNEFNTLRVAFKIAADRTIRAETTFKNTMPQVFYTLDKYKFNTEDESRHLIPGEIESTSCSIHLASPSELDMDSRAKLYKCTNTRAFDYQYELFAFAVNGFVRKEPSPYLKVKANKTYGPFFLSKTGKKDQIDLQSHWQHQETFPLVKFSLGKKEDTAMVRHMPTGRKVSIQADLQCSEVDRKDYLDQDSLLNYTKQQTCSYTLADNIDQVAIEIDGKTSYVGKAGAKTPRFIQLKAPANGRVYVQVNASHSSNHHKTGFVGLKDLKPAHGPCSK